MTKVEEAITYLNSEVITLVDLKKQELTHSWLGAAEARDESVDFIYRILALLEKKRVDPTNRTFSDFIKSAVRSLKKKSKGKFDDDLNAKIYIYTTAGFILEWIETTQALSLKDFINHQWMLSGE